MFSLTCSDLPDIQFEVKSTVSNDFTLSLRLSLGHLLRISPVAPVTPSKANEGGERLVDIGTAAQPAQYISSLAADRVVWKPQLRSISNLDQRV